MTPIIVAEMFKPEKYAAYNGHIALGIAMSFLLGPIFGGAISDGTIESRDEAAEVIANALMMRLSKALGVLLDNLDVSQSIHSYGVDSLVAEELRNWFKFELGADVAVFEMLGNSTSKDFGRLVAGKSQLVMKLLGDA